MGQQAFAYRSLSVDLSVARPTATLVPGVDPGVPLASVLIAVVPTGAVASLSFGGPSNDAVPAIAGFSLIADDCDPLLGGIYVTNVAQPGVAIQIVAVAAGGVAIQGVA